ncbi:MAG: AAA family ATPase, partial [Patescibacteria group bacterium]
MTIKRDIQKEIEEHLKHPEITLILGPRQAGKTYIMRQVEDKLKKTGQRTLFLNLDTETDKKYFDSQLNLISKIKTELGETGTVF